MERGRPVAESEGLAFFTAKLMAGGTRRMYPNIMRIIKEKTSWAMTCCSSMTTRRAISATPLPINDVAMAKGASCRVT